jgi:hypothetical protein
MDGTAKSRRREQLRNPHKAVTMSSDRATRATRLSIPSGKATALNVSLQSAAFYLRGFAGLAHG